MKQERGKLEIKEKGEWRTNKGSDEKIRKYVYILFGNMLSFF